MLKMIFFKSNPFLVKVEQRMEYEQRSLKVGVSIGIFYFCNY